MLPPPSPSLPTGLPSIDSVTPNFAAAGEPILLTGTGLAPTTQVLFGDLVIPVSSFQDHDDTSISLLVPSGALEFVPIVAQVVTNGLSPDQSGFESGTMDGWTAHNPQSLPDLSLGVTTDQAHSGTHSLELALPGRTGFFFDFSFDFTFGEDQPYEIGFMGPEASLGSDQTQSLVSAWVRPGAASRECVLVGYSEGIVIELAQFPELAEQWTQVEVTVSLEQPGSGLGLGLLIPAAQGGDVHYLDQVSIQRVDLTEPVVFERVDQRPELYAVAPPEGVPVGTRVRLEGNHLDQIVTLLVIFEDDQATDDIVVTDRDDTSITLELPNCPGRLTYVGSAQAMVVDHVGRSATIGLLYTPIVPVLHRVDPPIGNSGDLLTIRGLHLEYAQFIRFGDSVEIPANEFVRHTPTEIDVIAP